MQYAPPGTGRLAAGQACSARRCRSRQAIAQLSAPNGYIWYSLTTFTVDIAITDGLPHKLSIYLGRACSARRCRSKSVVTQLSAPNGYIWDHTTRRQTITVQDANTGVVLDTQSLSSSFNGGLYLSWTITGHVKLVFTNIGASPNAVVSGLFFDSAPARCLFLGTDTTTVGNWKGVYGADGYNIIHDTVSYPSYATVSETGETLDYWTLSTTDVRGLEKVVSGRLAALWYSITNFTVDINFTDGNAHKLSIYCVDWDLTTRRQTIAVKDANTGAVLNTQDLNSSFNGGLYLSWTITGHVKLVFTNVGSSRNAVVSGLFFDSFPTPPTGGYGVIAMGAGLTRSIGVDANGHPVVRQYHTDAQGSVLAITDGTGAPVTNYQIDAWGNVLSGSAPGNAFDFLGGLGYWSDPDLGLHYVRARWLNPQFGSWMSVDPHLDQFAYQYANNMPTTGTDPSGKDADTDYYHKINVSELQHDLHSKNAGVRADAEAEKIRRIRLHLLPPDWESANRSPRSGKKAIDPNAKNTGGFQHWQHTNDHQRPGQKPGGPASTIDVTGSLYHHAPLPYGVIDVTSDFGPVDSSTAADVMRQMNTMDLLATGRRRLAAIKQNSALVRKATEANKANIARLQNVVANRSAYAGSTFGQIFSRSTYEYFNSQHHNADTGDFLLGEFDSARSVLSTAKAILTPSTYPKAAQAVYNTLEDKGPLQAFRDTVNSFESSLHFWEKPDMRSAGASFFNLEMIAASELATIRTPSAVLAAEATVTQALVTSRMARTLGAGVKELGPAIGSGLRAARLVRPVAWSMRVASYAAAPFAFTLSRYATFWSGWQGGAFEAAQKLSKLGRGTTIEGTVGGRALGALNNAYRSLGLGNDLPGWTPASKVFSSSPRLRHASVALRGFVDDAAVDAELNAFPTKVWGKTEYPTLQARQIQPVNYKIADMEGLTLLQQDPDLTLFAIRHVQLWSEYSLRTSIPDTR